MPIYNIKDHEVPLFPTRYVRYIFGTSKTDIIKKEQRGHLPPANFRSENNNRLYSIEDLAIIEYIYKEIYPFRQGAKVPEWVKELVKEALAQSKRVVIQWGKSQNTEDWRELDKKYVQFDRFRAQIYIDSWRRRLLDINKFFPELCEDNEI